MRILENLSEAKELIGQEVSSDRHIVIPEEVRDVYRLYRPTPLYRAKALELELDTPAKIYYKYEGVSPTGSHKPNTAIPQAYYNKKEGIDKITTETGAGQWGSSLAFACSKFVELIALMIPPQFDFVVSSNKDFSWLLYGPFSLGKKDKSKVF